MHGHLRGIIRKLDKSVLNVEIAKTDQFSYVNRDLSKKCNPPYTPRVIETLYLT